MVGAGLAIAWCCAHTCEQRHSLQVHAPCTVLRSTLRLLQQAMDRDSFTCDLLSNMNLHSYRASTQADKGSVVIVPLCILACFVRHRPYLSPIYHFSYLVVSCAVVHCPHCPCMSLCSRLTNPRPMATVISQRRGGFCRLSPFSARITGMWRVEQVFGNGR